MAHNIDFQLAPPDHVAVALGATLARLRLARNITQQALAERSGVSERTVKRFEGGQGASLDTLIRLLQALELADRLQYLLPDPGIQPAQRLKGERPERKRARAASKPRRKPWSWDEEQTP